MGQSPSSVHKKRLPTNKISDLKKEKNEKVEKAMEIERKINSIKSESQRSFATGNFQGVDDKEKYKLILSEITEKLYE